TPDPAVPGMLSLKPDEDGVKRGDYPFSTNCGWIDWPHADGSAARNLLADVHSASDALRMQQQQQQAAPGSHTVEPGMAGHELKDECPKQYEPKEKAESTIAATPVVRTEHSDLYDTHSLLGFQVAQSDASRFSAHIKELADILDGDNALGLEL